MPAISVSDKVLVTGANGFIGRWLVHLLLQQRYSVRTAVRSADKGEAILKTVSAKLPERSQNVQYVVVPDFTAEHAYDDAVRGVAGIVHVASPNGRPVPDPQMIIRPAVDATAGLVKSAIAHGDALKRIVITSSIKAILGPEYGRTYTEEDWAEHAVKEVEEKGAEADGMAVYTASKVLAEKAACKLREDNKDRISWDISVVCPGWVFGPPMDNPASPAALTSTASIFYEVFTGNPMWSMLFQLGHNFVDVRDVAQGMLKALEIEGAGGERFLMTSQWLTWQEYFNTARELNYFPKLDKGDPRRSDGVPPARIGSNEKAKRVLGITFRTMPETLKDILDDYRARGWLAEYE
ncbi:hypothetical protein V8D89_002619 [Ganoderma adspersum]